MKKFFTTKNPDSLLRILLFAWWIINMIQAAFTELANDEAYYWVFAQNLSWGYFDHPPMTALLVWLGNLIGGELGVRFFFVLLQPIYLYVIWLVIRPESPRVTDAWLYFLICAGIPILQLYGFIAVPDGPLMLFTALFLYWFKKFTENNTWKDAVLLGIMMAALAYSKYQAALVVLFAFCANPKLFRNPKTYVAGLITLVLFLPHLWWQYQNDWVSFHYHLSGRNGYFRWSYVTEYLLNLLLVFNPLFVPLYIKGWKKGALVPHTPVVKAMYVMIAGFVIFFGLSSLRGYVQPQWVIPITFGLIMILFNYGREHEKAGRYVRTCGWVTIGLVMLVRVVMIFNPIGIKFEVFDNKASYSQIAEIADGRTVIFAGSYSAASKYEFYGHGKAFAQPSVNYRTSHWPMLDTDTRAAGQPVVVQTVADISDHSVKLANGSDFAWVEIDDFRPTRKVDAVLVSGEVPSVTHPGDTLRLTVRLANPYRYDIPVLPDGTALLMIWGRNKEHFHEFPVADAKFVIPAGGSISHYVEFVIPEDLPLKKNYRVGFALKYDKLNYWFNGDEYKTDLTAR